MKMCKGKFSLVGFGLFGALLLGACVQETSRGGIPPEVNAVIATVSDDIAQARYEKIYNEAADEWRRDATLDQSNNVFTTLKAKLGAPGNRVFHSATEQSNSSGRSYIITYETRFERGEGMEVFTIVERNGRWLLARYVVNSTELK